MPRKPKPGKSLAEVNPELAKQWHPTKNGDLTPFDLTVGSNKKVWWKCPKGKDHEWQAHPNQRLNKGQIRKCSICSNRTTVKSNSLLVTHPEIASQWHPTKNKNLKPIDVNIESSLDIWWKCNKGDDHEWKTKINKRKRTGCPYCMQGRNKRVSKSNSLKLNFIPNKFDIHIHMNNKIDLNKLTLGSSRKIWWQCSLNKNHIWEQSPFKQLRSGECPKCKLLVEKNPELIKEWCFEKNMHTDINTVLSKTNIRYWWNCSKVKSHSWMASPNTRTLGHACPFCTLTPQSREELTITFELIKIFKDINPKGHKLKVKGKLRSIDIFLPHLNIGIEFDGSYWHKDKREKDKMKTLDIEEQGINIIRVRQKPLKRIFEDDVMAEKKFDGKQITNDILKQIMKDYKLDKRTLTKIDNYIAQEGLQNEKELDKYIDQILTEKVGKKKNQ